MTPFGVLQEIVVVSGLPRSGTSMAMGMLREGGLTLLEDGVRTADTDNPKGYFELELVKSLPESVEWLEEARGRVVKVVSNFLSALPDDHTYGVIFMERCIEDVVRSQNAMLKRRGEGARASVDTQQISDLLTRHLRVVRSDLARRDRFRTIFLNYDHVIDQPEEGAERIQEFLGRELDVRRMVGFVDSRLRRSRSFS